MTAPIPADGLQGTRLAAAVAAVVLAIFLAAMDISIANTALPTIAQDLAASPADSVWVVNAYQLAVVATLLPFASIGEIAGYRRVYTWGLAVFTAASVACALCDTLPALTAARIAQGLGASGIMSVNTALIRFIYPARSLGKGYGMNALTVAVSTAIGPTVAAGILSVASWQWLFAINLPIGLFALALGLRALPETALGSHRFDAASAALNACAFGCLVLGITQAAHSAPAMATLPWLAAAGISFVLLLRRQSGQAAPMLPLDLYRIPMFALSSATAFCSFAAQGIGVIALPFYFQSVLGLSAVETGVLLTPWPAMTAVMAPIAGRLSDRYPPAVLGGIGLGAFALGLALTAALPEHPGTWGITWRMLLCGTGFGFFQSPNQRAIMASAPPARSGGASGIVATSRLVGQSIGSALVALCLGLSVVYGPSLALALAALFAATGALVSLSRLLAPPAR